MPDASRSTARVLVFINAYFDESGKTGGLYFVLGGYIGSPETWERFRLDWNENLLKKFGIRYMNAKEMWSNKKNSPFQNKQVWTDEHKSDATALVGQIIKRHPVAGFVIYVEKQRYRQIYENFHLQVRASKELHSLKKQIPGFRTHYGVCVRHLVATLPLLFGYSGRNGRFGDEKLDGASFVLDHGNGEFANQAKAAVNHARVQWEEKSIELAEPDGLFQWKVGDCIELDDKMHPQLQAADMLSYLFRRDIEGKFTPLFLLLDEQDPEKHMHVPIEDSTLLSVALGRLAEGFRAGILVQQTRSA